MCKTLSAYITHVLSYVATEEEGEGEGEGEGEREGGTLFFRYGVGTQLMLAATSSSAKALLEDTARRCLDNQEMRALTDRTREVGSN